VSPAEREARAAAIVRDLQVRAAAQRRALRILADPAQRYGDPSIARTRAHYELLKAHRATSLDGAA
jgi:hypothetical protein